MSKVKNFTVTRARPLPVIVLADISGSMSVEGKIEALNRAVGEMIDSLGQETDIRAEIYVALITFGRGGANIHQPLMPADKVQWTDMQADGPTPLGAALDLATSMVEDRNQIPSRAYYPTLVLVSDGQPTDERGRLTDNWKEPLERLLHSERASKAVRLAMAIGADADLEVLQAFIGNPDIPVFRAEQSRQIRQFFRWVTMTVTTRSKSVNPNSVPIMAPDTNEDLEDLV